MKTIDAYEMVLKKLDVLKEEGIEFSIEESVKTQPILEKYDNPNYLPVDKWMSVVFKVKDVLELNKIHNVEHFFKMNGFTFDTEFGLDSRKWEIDWSFKTT